MLPDQLPQIPVFVYLSWNLVNDAWGANKKEKLGRK